MLGTHSPNALEVNNCEQNPLNWLALSARAKPSQGLASCADSFSDGFQLRIGTVKKEIGTLEPSPAQDSFGNWWTFGAKNNYTLHKSLDALTGPDNPRAFRE